MNSISQLLLRKRNFGLAVLVSLALGLFPMTAATRSGAVRVTVGEPSVWSLEQAHYLLERLRNKNGKIESSPFTHTDPNQVNSSRLDAVRRVFGLGLEYDQSVGVKNRMLAGQYESNIAMRSSLAAQWHDLLKQQGNVDASLQLARVELARMGTAAATTEERQIKSAEIAALEKNKTEIEARMGVVQQAMGSTGVTPSFTAPGKGGTLPGLPDTMDPAQLKAVLKRVSDHQPSLDASAALDNHIQFNYELISKQLTLLRDEVGPGKRILFFELPQTVLGVPGKGDDHLAQSWWRVEGLFRGRLKPSGSGAGKRLPGRLSQADFSAAKSRGSSSAPFTPSNAQSGAYRDWAYLTYEAMPSEDVARRTTGSVRSVELIPRINSLNISESHSAVKTSALSIIGSFLWGFGAQMNYQKQRETFDQFLQQEVYASGHGKGLSEFDWIFGPKPGSKFVAPGIRTTYAVMVVPDDAAYLELAGRGCQYHRKTTPNATYPSLTKFAANTKAEDIECGVEYTFQVQVPPLEEGFSIDEIDYMPVKAGERSTLILRGFDISPQISVLIDGIPLTKVLSLGSPKAWADEHAEVSDLIRGRMEYLSSSELAITFSMPDAYIGTPKITLVTPTKAYTLNRLEFRKIAGCYQKTKSTECPSFNTAEEMTFEGFSNKPGRQMFYPGLALNKVEILSLDKASQKVAFTVSGRGFDLKTVWLLNGSNTACTASSVTLVSARLDCDRPKSFSWVVGAIGHDPKNPDITSFSLSDPYPPQIQKTAVLEVIAAVADDKKSEKKSPAKAKILFTVQYFNAKQVWKLDGKVQDQVEIRSPQEVAVTVSLEKELPKLDFVVTGTAKDPEEKRSVEIKEWK